MEEFEKQLAKQKEQKLSELFRLQERRLSEYKSIIAQLSEQKQKLTNINGNLERRIVELVEDEQKKENNHNQQIKKYIGMINGFEEEKKKEMDFRIQRQEQILRLEGSVRKLENHIKQKNQRIEQEQQKCRNRVQQKEKQIEEMKVLIQKNNQQNQRNINIITQKHKQQMVLFERSLKFELDQKLKSLGQTKSNQNIERQSRIKYLQTQNLKLVDQNSIKQNSIVALKKRNLQLEEQLSSQNLRWKLQVKEKQFEMQTLRKQLAFQKQQNKIEVGKQKELMEEKQETKQLIENIKKKAKDEVKENKIELEKNFRQYKEINQSQNKKYQKQISELQHKNEQLKQQIKMKENQDQKNILKFKSEMNDKRQQYEEELRDLRKKESQLRLQLETRTNERNKLDDQMEKQKIKIANAMKIFEELGRSKLELEKENKYMLSEIKYWRDKFRDLEKEKGKEKGRGEPNQIPLPKKPEPEQTVIKNTSKPAQSSFKKQKQRQIKYLEDYNKNDSIKQRESIKQPTKQKQEHHEPKKQQEKHRSKVEKTVSHHPLRLQNILSDQSEQIEEREQSDELQDVLDNYKLSYEEKQNSKSKIKSNKNKHSQDSQHLRNRVEESNFSFPQSSQFDSLYRFAQND